MLYLSSQVHQPKNRRGYDVDAYSVQEETVTLAYKHAHKLSEDTLNRQHVNM